MSQRWILCCAVLCWGLAVQPAAAHEGHDHAAASTPAEPLAAARAAAAGAQFELVAVAGSGELVLYVDRFLTNEPVAGAAVEVETPEGAVAASAAEAGTYRLKAPWLTRPGHHPLIVTVHAGGTAEVMPLGIDVIEHPAPDGIFGLADGRAGSAVAVGYLLSALAAGLAAGMILTGFARRRGASRA